MRGGITMQKKDNFMDLSGAQTLSPQLRGAPVAQ